MQARAAGYPYTDHMNEIARCLALAALVANASAYGQANGKLQLHFMDVGQGDGALLISPLGETVLFDDGVRNDCDRVKAYVQQLGVTKIDYHIASHYHDDHIGCAVPVLQEFPLQKQAFDRGFFYPTGTFTNYFKFVGAKRRTAIEGAGLTLDETSPHPVKIEFAALNGDGVPTSNENDLSLVCVVRFGQFDAVLGGDLSGVKELDYKDIETSVGPKVGQVEVYKVNHHGSRYSSNTNWLQTIKPKIGIISCGLANIHNHPTSECLERLHTAGVVTYWTESGNGVAPMAGRDKVGGTIIVETAPAASTFTVTYSGTRVDSFDVWNPLNTPGPGTQYAWSSKAQFFHFANCRYVSSINPSNLVAGTIPPTNKTLHVGCPK
jgi:beta-lactamase superfamily II metal-dependent hydrolase